MVILTTLLYTVILLERLVQAQLTVNLSKSEFAHAHVTYLFMDDLTFSLATDMYFYVPTNKI